MLVHYGLHMLASAVVPLGVGLWLGWRARNGPHSNRRLAFLVLGFVIIWYLASVGLRRYANTDLPAWAWAEAWAQRGKWLVFLGGIFLFLGFIGRSGQLARSGGRNQVVWIISVMVLMFGVVVWRTVPVYPFLPRDTRRDEQGFLRQSGEYTCGPVALANLLDLVHGIRDGGERKLARLSGTTFEGTTTTGLLRAAEGQGLRVVACRRMSLGEVRELGSLAIVYISTVPSVQHAMLLIGMSSGGKRVSFVDPDRGYLEMSRERFERVWYGKTLVFERVAE